MITYGANIAAARARRKLDESADTGNRVLERLSSGLRINHASDDAAGLAISTTLKADTRVFTQSIRNVQDGISYLSIADGALSEMTKIIDRQKELATQMSSSIYNSTQRSASQKESNALTDQFNTLIASTSFNGRQIFDSNLQALRIQFGAGAQNSLTVTPGQALATTTTTGAGVATTSDTFGSGTQQQFTVTLNNPPVALNESADITVTSTPTQGSPVSETWSLDNIVTAGAVGAGDSFTIYDTSNSGHTFYFSVDGNDGGGTGIQVAIDSSLTDSGYVANQIVNAIQSAGLGVSAYSFNTNNVEITTGVCSNLNNPDISGLSGEFTVAATDGSAINVNDPGYITFSLPGQSYYVYFTVDDSFTGGGIRTFNPNIGGYTGINVSISANDSANTIASDIVNAISLFGLSADLSTSGVNGNFRIFDGTNSHTDLQDTAVNGSSPLFSVSNHANGNQGGDTFTFNDGTTDYYVWFFDGVTADPMPPGETPLTVVTTSNSNPTAAEVASFLDAALCIYANGNPHVNVSVANYSNGQTSLTIINNVSQYVAISPNLTSFGNISISGVNPGSDPDANATTNQIYIANHGFSTGTAVTYSTTGSAVGGLSNGTTYYVISDDSNHVRLATSKANALSGTSIDITSGGSGTHTLTSTTGTPVSTTTSLSASYIDLSSVATSRNSLTQLATLATNVQQETSNIGAAQSRLNATLSVLQTTREQYQSAESRITSDDVAADSALLVKQNILKEIGAAVLSHANLDPQIALKLLQG